MEQYKTDAEIYEVLEREIIDPLQHLVNFSISFVLFHYDSPKRKALLCPTSPSSSLCSMPPLLAGEALAEVISF